MGFTGVRRLLASLVEGSGENRFLADFLPFQRKVAGWGMYTALSQTLLKLVAPGVPEGLSAARPRGSGRGYRTWLCGRAASIAFATMSSGWALRLSAPRKTP